MTDLCELATNGWNNLLLTQRMGEHTVQLTATLRLP